MYTYLAVSFHSFPPEVEDTSFSISTNMGCGLCPTGPSGPSKCFTRVPGGVAKNNNDYNYGMLR